MGFSRGKISINLEDITNQVNELDILFYYLGINKIPCFIKSPLRNDKHPSFGLYSSDGIRIYYTDLATGDRGGLYDLLGHIWGMDYTHVLEKIYKDLPNFHINSSLSLTKSNINHITNYNKSIDLKCKIREWKDYDIEYWKSYGISLSWLKYAEVYPISHKIIIKDNKTYTFPADKYAYVFVERKENNITLKIYQPFNLNGYKWCNKHDSSVISLWTKIPKYGDKVCICASLKDALCLWSNTDIPAIAVQGEGYNISNTAIQELKKRYKQIYILFDNDPPGLVNGVNLAEKTGFCNIVLPNIYEAKDVSDLFKVLQDKEKFKTIIINLFK